MIEKNETVSLMQRRKFKFYDTDRSTHSFQIEQLLIFPLDLLKTSKFTKFLLNVTEFLNDSVLLGQLASDLTTADAK